MKLIYALLFVSTAAFAGNEPSASYFNRFVTAFSSASVGEDEYNALVSVKMDPGMSASYDYSPPESYLDKDGKPNFVINNADLLFKGAKSRELFLDFVRSNILSPHKVETGKEITYQKNNVIYTFKVDEYQQNNIVISENMLSTVVDSETSCEYSFTRKGQEFFKLTRVFCAG